MSNRFYYGQQDYIVQLNLMDDAFQAGPYSAVPLSGNVTMTGPLTIPNPTFTGTVTGVSKAAVGLGDVDNTSDVNKPISTATQTALNGKQNSLGFTPVQQGTGVNQVSNIVKVGWTNAARLRVTVDTADMGNFALEGTANSYSSLQTFNGAAQGLSSTFAPSPNWTLAALRAYGAYGGGVIVQDSVGGGVNGGVMYTQNAELRFANVSNQSLGNPLVVGTNYFAPAVDRGNYLGLSNYRWDTVYAFQGTINTSDATHKTNIDPLTPAEINWSKSLASEIGMYQFLSSIEEKGEDNARTHCGMTVQRAIELGQAAGVNPFKYAFICLDEWPEKIEKFPAQYAPDTISPAKYEEIEDEEGNIQTILVKAEETIKGELIKDECEVVTPAGQIYSFRPDQLNSFIVRGIAARLDAIEAQLSSVNF